MANAIYPTSSRYLIPAECYNLARLAHLRVQRWHSFGLPGLRDNYMWMGEHQWQLWNRKLDTLLVSWADFRNGDRNGLHEPVVCTQTVHHSYARTVIHHVNSSLLTYLTRAMRNDTSHGSATVIPWPPS